MSTNLVRFRSNISKSFLYDVVVFFSPKNMILLQLLPVKHLMRSCLCSVQMTQVKTKQIKQKTA